MRPSAARRAAFDALLAVEQRSADPTTVLHAARYQELSASDRDLATELTFGVLRNRACLDHVLSYFSKRPFGKTDLSLRTALRIGLYQIRFLDRIPDRAAVDESVRLARTFGPRGGEGFVNAVLRNALRAPDASALPSVDDDPLKYLTITLSHPSWLATRYLKRMGIDRARALCQRQNAVPETYLRVSAALPPEEAARRLGEEGVVTAPVPLAPNALRVVSGRSTSSSLYRDGLVFAQDIGSQLIARLVASPGPGWDDGEGPGVLDLCAAPGGKATAIAEACAPAPVIGLDRRFRRAQLLTTLARRLRTANVLPVVADAARPPTRLTFRSILLDAPCSSSGTLRRNPDIKWKLQEQHLQTHRNRQLELLRSASALLAAGGRLVYATCSSEPEENELVVSAFLADNQTFQRVDPRPLLPESARHLVDAHDDFRTSPLDDETDAYFATVLIRRS